MFQLAIFKTLLEKQRLAEVELKKLLPDDTQAHHSLFYQSVDTKTGLLRPPSKNEKVGRLSDLLKYHTKQVSAEKIVEVWKKFTPKTKRKKPQRKTMQLYRSSSPAAEPMPVKLLLD